VFAGPLMLALLATLLTGLVLPALLLATLLTGLVLPTLLLLATLLTTLVLLAALIVLVLVVRIWIVHGLTGAARTYGVFIGRMAEKKECSALSKSSAIHTASLYVF
jgi:hypothetical protein